MADVVGKTNNMSNVDLVCLERIPGKVGDVGNRRTSPGFYTRECVSHGRPWYVWPRSENGHGRTSEAAVFLD